jgi:hypothetical protein
MTIQYVTQMRWLISFTLATTGTGRITGNLRRIYGEFTENRRGIGGELKVNLGNSQRVNSKELVKQYVGVGMKLIND